MQTCSINFGVCNTGGKTIELTFRYEAPPCESVTILQKQDVYSWTEVTGDREQAREEGRLVWEGEE